MDNVVPIEANQPHIAEKAQCRRCRYGWVAVIVATANPWLLECPRCGKLWGHIPHAQPESPYQAKAWAEEMWNYWYYEKLPGSNVDVVCESPNEMDGYVGYAENELTSGDGIQTESRLLSITSSQKFKAEQTPSSTSGHVTNGVTLGVDGEIPRG